MSLYRLEVLPLAKEDMVGIVGYIGRELKNPTAANRLADEFFEAMESLTDFPYANPVLVPIRPLKFEYRKLMVGSYTLFYRVCEPEKLVIVARVLYSKRDFSIANGHLT